MEIGKEKPPGWTFWIDRGGTFTDVIGRGPDGASRTVKLSSASGAYADAAVEAMRRVLGARPGDPFPAGRVEAVKMGTTVATNALLERTGAKTLLVTTAGFADALVIGDQTRPSLFALDIVKPEPLHAGVVEAGERLAADGSVVRPLDEGALARALGRFRDAGFESVAIAFMHSDLNPTHEAQAARIARGAGFSFVAASYEVSPLPRFIPRAETTVADAYLTPGLRAYVARLTAALGGVDLYFMTSGGGLVRANAFRARDAVVSGPAGGVVAVTRTAAAAGARAVLGFDMGGTSTDVCRFAGAMERRDVAQVAGARLRAPMLDVESIAAGGGSILAFDGLRARVGPASAGADPGPAAYGRGGPATVTDANLVLGRLDAACFPPVFGMSGEAPLDLGAARERLGELARAMGSAGPEAAAEGFLALAVEQAAAAIRRISTERGFDPRAHGLVAFGGAAGQVACEVAEALEIEEILCPRYASLLSAWGIGQATMRALRQAGLERPLGDAGLAAAEALLDALAGQARTDLAGQGALAGAVERRLHIRYDEADTALTVEMGGPGEVAAAFEAAHQRLFGFIEAGRPMVISSVEVEAREGDKAEEGSLPPSAHGKGRSRSDPGGEVSIIPDVMDASHFPTPAFQADPPHEGEGGEGGTRRVIRADALRTPLEGPLLIIRDDTQIWLAEGWRAVPGADGLIRLVRVAERARRPVVGENPDPVTLALFNRRFMGVAEAMGAALERTARSVNIKERLDFSCALFDAGGDLVANAPHMPVHLGSMGASVRAVRARHPQLKAGDAFALNNPYAGGTHLPDITVVTPVFVGKDPNPAFFVAARGHHADVGGTQPGSMPPFSRVIDEEGVLLDALPILRDGRFLEDEVLAALTAGPWPARAPGRNIGDLKAQIAACRAGATAILAMIEVHGADAVARYMGFVQANAEACVRRAIGRLADGEARLAMDGGGEIAVKITVQAALGEADLDFTGSSPQLPSNFNAPASIVDAAALYVFRALVDDDIPLNAGCLTPLKVIVPEGSMLNPRPPGAVVAGNVETSQHLVDALLGALGVMADSQGTMNNVTFGDETRQYYETLCGGAGATARAPGASAVHTHMTNSRLTDPEILERRFAVRVEAFAVRRGSGGLGAHGGGDGALRRIRFLAPMEAALLSTRRDHPPRGLAGGGAGQGGRQRLILADGTVKELPGCFSLKVQPGDAIEIETPGGGGFGPPAKSDG
ncbi:MAG: hydantoinase B/oxoprolinase family protein [Pseudomonadota bacterium]